MELNYLRDKKVSIIMGTYNEKVEWVDECIESILNQTYKNIEFIIVLDNPNNIELKDFLNNKAQRDKRIKFIINNENLGLVKTLNKAIKVCTGEYIARMDADDISDLTRIEKQVEFLESNLDIALVGTKVEYINEEGIIERQDGYRPITSNAIREHLKYHNAFAHPTIMFVKDKLIEIGGYNDVSCAEDYELFTRYVYSNNKVANINEVLLKYRVRKNSISQQNKVKQFMVAEYISLIYRKNLKNQNIKFNNNDLEIFLNDQYRRENYEAYIVAFDNYKKTKNIKYALELLLVVFRNKEILYLFLNKTKYSLTKTFYKN